MYVAMDLFPNYLAVGLKEELSVEVLVHLFF